MRYSDRFSFRREQQTSSRFGGIPIFKSDKLYSGMISELFKTKELREWRGMDREDLQKAIVDQMNRIVDKGLGGGRRIPGERYEIRCKLGSSQLYVRCAQRLCSFMARFCKDGPNGYYKYSIMSILYHYSECHDER